MRWRRSKSRRRLRRAGATEASRPRGRGAADRLGRSGRGGERRARSPAPAAAVRRMRSSSTSPQALAVRLEGAPDTRLVETARQTSAPRRRGRGPSVRRLRQAERARPEIEGRRAADRAYGRRARPQRRGHRSAIANLPGAVTLGFAPYGAAIEERAAEARQAGHETALQAPMEGFSDWADDPRPHTLKTSASDADNLDSLRWLMSRFTGYVAVVNSSRRQVHRRATRDIAGCGGSRGTRPRISRRRLFAAQRRAGRRRDACHAVGARGRCHRRQRRRLRRSKRRWRGSSIARASEARRLASPPLRRRPSNGWPDGRTGSNRRVSRWSRSPPDVGAPSRIGAIQGLEPMSA